MKVKNIVHSKRFENIVIFMILLNAIFIGVQTSVKIDIVDSLQLFILLFFIIELLLRWFAKKSISQFLKNGWNWFDFIIIVITLIPESIVQDSELILLLRFLKVLRILRIFKALPELRLMVAVMFKSFKSVGYAGLLLLLFMYIYAVVGVVLFKDLTTVITAHTDYIDPFGTIGESFFSLFRISTGEDWTDLRYNLLQKNINYSSVVINIYFISWYVFSAFILLNIVFGAIINNYEVLYSKDDKLHDKINSLEREIANLVKSIDKKNPKK